MTIRRLAWCSLSIAISTLLPACALAQDQVDEQARSATANCHEALQPGQPQTFEAGLCMGILKGLHYLSKDICIPPATSLGQIGNVVSKHIAENPGEINDDFQESALKAMRSAWPCGAHKDI
jgi:hypothetical protein